MIEVTQGTLTIEPGVTVMFENGAGILVKEEGSITAIGEQGNEVYFVSKNGKRGDWNGITVLSSKATNVFSYCRFEHGGHVSNEFGRANLIIGSHTNPAKAEVSHNTITTSAGNGIIISEGSEIRGFNSNNISVNTGYPVSIHITNAGSLEDGNTYSNNGKEFIELTGSGDNLILKPAVINPLNESYALSGHIIAGNNITIGAGTHIYMNSGAQLTLNGIEGSGSLTAVGSQSRPITFTGVYATIGLWNAINFKSSASALNQLEHCIITGGGGIAQNNLGMLNFMCSGAGPGQISIRNCTVSNSAANGIYIQKSNTTYNTDIETANTFSGNTGVNVYYDVITQ